MSEDKQRSVSECPEMDYFMNKSISDVTFVIDGQPLPAIKLILSLKNKVFRSMFSDNFKESKDNEIDIKDTSFEAFKTLIRFLYSDQLVLKDENDFELIGELCKLCDRYEAIGLMRKMSKKLNKIELTFDNMTSISKIAFEYKFEDLMSKVMVFIDTNFDEIVNRENKELKYLYDSTDGRLLEVMASKFRDERAREPRLQPNSETHYAKCSHCRKHFKFSNSDN